MGDEKKEEKKGYTFLDRRGLNKDSTEKEQGMKKPPEQPKEGPVPKGSVLIDFATLIMSFASASMISMGIVPDPATGTIQKNLVIAQQNIDVISLLKEKTRGNLSQEEERLIEQILYELRMHYVEALKDKQ
jgi:hypothetical protein